MPRTNVEYATDNITVYRWCRWQCAYCWAWRIPLFRNRILRGKYNPVKEAEKYARIKEKRTIVVSFTSDPYPPDEIDLRWTRKVLLTLSKTNHKVMVLTKAPNLACMLDLDVFIFSNAEMWLGTTVISLEKTDLEPLAPKPQTRLNSLKYAKQYGIKTWLSIEPIIPGVTFPEKIVEETLSYVDFYVLGSFNYSRQLGFEISEDLKKKWYRKHVPKAIELLKKHGKRFLVKKELKKYMGGYNEK